MNNALFILPTCVHCYISKANHTQEDTPIVCSSLWFDNCLTIYCHLITAKNVSYARF